jgi:uracil-DNA glycosylase family 4
LPTLSLMATKWARYAALVSARKGCRACCPDLTNPSVIQDGSLDCDEVGAWSRWQGNVDAELMVVGQDWGDEDWFIRSAGKPTSGRSASVTNRNLQKLVASIGYPIELFRETSDRGMLFFTNAVLCLKKGGAQADVRREWFNTCGDLFGRPLIEIVRPKVVVTLGGRAYRAVLAAFAVRPIKFSQAVDCDSPVQLSSEISAFAVYHCGSRTVNTHRSLAAQLEDWSRIGRFLARAHGS